MEQLVLGILERNDPNPGIPSREQMYLSFLLCKNLSDLCNSGRAILNDIKSKGGSLHGLPDASMIELCEHALRILYNDNMFIEDDEIGSRPEWKNVTSFDKRRGGGAYRLYRCISRNVLEKEGGKDIVRAVRKKNTDYFVKNFNMIFADLPNEFRSSLDQYKNFLTSKEIDEETRDDVWSFFESILDLFVYQEDNISMLKGL